MYKGTSSPLSTPQGYHFCEFGAYPSIPLSKLCARQTSQVAVPGQGRCGLGALGQRTHFRVGLGTMIAQGQRVKWDNKRLQMVAPGRAGKESGQCNQEVGGETSWTLRGPRGLSSLPSHCLLEFLHCHVSLGSELKGQVANRGPMKPLKQG